MISPNLHTLPTHVDRSKQRNVIIFSFLLRCAHDQKKLKQMKTFALIFGCSPPLVSVLITLYPRTALIIMSSSILPRPPIKKLDLKRGSRAVAIAVHDHSVLLDYELLHVMLTWACRPMTTSPLINDESAASWELALKQRMHLSLGAHWSIWCMIWTCDWLIPLLTVGDESKSEQSE